MSEYTPLSKLLHHLALGSNIVPEITFDIERSMYGSSAESVVDNKHVFIAGLARAGTTILMRSLYETGKFCSLTYRDMPFVLAPNFWEKLSGSSRKDMEATERAHGDGIQVDFDSPEALEEVYWRVSSAGAYIKCSCIDAHSPASDDIEGFREYVALISLKYGKKFYLSKNNNNIVRVEAIKKALPQATVLIPFRSPLQHAYSLLKQHRLFAERHASDPFSRHYMNWLVHCEFGGGHKPFVWGKAVAEEYDINAAVIDQLDYWLAQWLGVYDHLYQQHANREGVLFVCYETLCEQTDSVWNGLSERLEFSPEGMPDLSLREATGLNIGNEALKQRAEGLYQKLAELSAESLLP